MGLGFNLAMNLKPSIWILLVATKGSARIVLRLHAHSGVPRCSINISVDHKTIDHYYGPQGALEIKMFALRLAISSRKFQL